MENLNAEQIKNEIQSLIKALKDCGGWVKRGNGEGWFNHEILADALTLITSQEQRIKELDEENAEVKANWQKLKESHESACEKCRAEFKRLTEENERLEKALVEQSAENVILCGEVKHARYDTVREMQERITVHATNGYPRKVRLDVIDQIAKEMVEGTNGI